MGLNPICWLEAIVRTLKTGVLVAGHQFREVSRQNNCVVTVTKCERCDKYNVSWDRTARSTNEPYQDERKVAK